LIYLLFMENLAIIQARPFSMAPKPGSSFAWRPVLVQRSALAVVIVALVIGGLPPDIASGEKIQASPVRPAQGWVSMTIYSNQSGNKISFPHTEHQTRLAPVLGSELSACQSCHHLNLPGDEATPCSACHRDYSHPTDIFQHTTHQVALGGNASCQECHTGEHLASTAVACRACHEAMTASQPEETFSQYAPDYLEAMHGLCLDCHTQEAAAQSRPELSQCGTCHYQNKQKLEIVYSNIQP
jgi:hypothetical protein